MNKQRLISIPSVVSTCLAILLASLLALEAHATNNLPATTVTYPAQQQDDNPRTAQLGENRGTVKEGESEIWTYQGQTGDPSTGSGHRILTIKAEADKPANEADPEERRQAGLLDMLLIVYAPDGTILAKADDIQPAVVTDSAIEGLQLPTDGTYKIEVLGLEKEGSGAYTLTLQAANRTPAEPTPTPDPDWPTLTIENQLEDTICYVYIWPTSTDELGDERLGTKEVISPNDQYQWPVPPDSYNIVLSDCYGNTLDFRQQFDVTQSSTLTVSPLDGPAAQCAEGVQLALDGKPREALPLLEAGFAERKKATFANPDDEGICALALGSLRNNFGDRSGALQAYQVALDIWKASGYRVGYGTTLNNMAEVYHNQGRYTEALDYFQQALEIVQEVGDRALEGSTFNNIGLVYDNQGRYTEALQYYQQALEIDQEVGDRASEGITLNNMAGIYDNQGRYTEALQYFKQVLDIVREAGDRAGEGRTLNNMAGVYSNQGMYGKALQYYQQALEISREVGHRAGEGNTLNNMALVYDNQGRYTEALQYYHKGLEIVREVGNRAGEGSTFNNMARVYDNQGMYGKALQYYQQALEISREVGNRAGEGTTLNNVAAVYLAQGRYIEALDYFQQAIEIYREVGDRAGYGTTLNNIGLVYDNQGRYAEALQYFQQALEILREVGNRAGYGTTLNNIAGVYHDQGRNTEALQYFQKALEIDREVGNRASEGVTLNGIAAVYHNQGRYTEGLDYFQQALEIDREVGDRALEGNTLNNIGFAYQQQGQAEEALVYYEQSMDIREALRATAGGDQERASFIAQYANLYNRAIGLYHQQGQDDYAFLTSELGRALYFLDSLATGYVQLSDDDLQELLRREREAYTERQAAQDALIRARALNPPDPESVADLEAQLEALDAAYDEVQADIEARGNELAALVPGRSNIPTLAEVQALLDEETTLLSYWVLGEEEGTLAFVITADELRVVELREATPEKLRTQVTNLHEWFNTDNAHPKPLRELYRWLVAPLVSELETPKVGIIGHQLLHYVPFAALTGGEEESYFGEQFTIFTLPSASALRFIEQNVQNLAPATQDAFVFGNPATDHPKFRNVPLAYAADEAANVAKLFDQVSVYMDGEASEARLRSEVEGIKGAGVVHLAAHGIYSSTNPLENSFIALAPGGEQDGRLAVSEVYGLDLSAAEMVVLSACQTQIGEVSQAPQAVSAGDELVGLTRAFFFAKTPTVVTSLWNVDDAATEALMSAFYRNWQAGMGKAEALQAAQAEVRKTYPSPFYWAAFVLNGDPGQVSGPPEPIGSPTETTGSESEAPPKDEMEIAWPLIAGIAGLLAVVVLFVFGIGMKKRWPNSA